MTLAELLTKGKPLPSKEKGKAKKTDPAQGGGSEQMKTTSTNNDANKFAVTARELLESEMTQSIAATVCSQDETP
jgi:hypothetical protein